MNRESFLIVFILTLIMTAQMWIHHLEIEQLIILSSTGQIAITRAFDIVFPADVAKEEKKK